VHARHQSCCLEYTPSQIPPSPSFHLISYTELHIPDSSIPPLFPSPPNTKVDKLDPPTSQLLQYRPTLTVPDRTPQIPPHMHDYLQRQLFLAHRYHLVEAPQPIVCVPHVNEIELVQRVGQQRRLGLDLATCRNEAGPGGTEQGADVECVNVVSAVVTGVGEDLCAEFRREGEEWEGWGAV
jgi:hypothetical protein